MYLFAREGLGQTSTTLQPRNLTPGSGYAFGPDPSALEGFGQPPPVDPVDITTYLLTEAEIKRQLERNFRADDVAGFLDRRRKLKQAFESVPKSFAQHLFGRLLNKNDPLAKLFNYKIATPTRKEMFSILLKKTGETI